MKLRIFLPSVERPDASTRFPWMLFDERRALLREGTSTLDEIPRGDRAEAVLPSTRVLFARLTLPKVSAAIGCSPIPRTSTPSLEKRASRARRPSR
jgi:hypothetical protein